MTSLIADCPSCGLRETVLDPEFVPGVLGEEIAAHFGSMCLACGAVLAFSGPADDGRPRYVAMTDTAHEWSELPLIGRARDAIDLTDRRSPVLALRLLLVLTNGAGE